MQVPILNHWWQTETGHAITASCIGLNHSVDPPRFTAGMPFPGYDGKNPLRVIMAMNSYSVLNCPLFFRIVRILRNDGTEADPLELGRIVVKLPLPPGTMSTLYKSEERFIETYFTKYPVSIRIRTY